MSEPELELVLRLVQDHHCAFYDVVLFYQQRLYAFAYRLTGSTQDAEDIVQEAFVSAYVTLENYSPQRIAALRLQSWLYRITFHTYTHRVRDARLRFIPLDAAIEDEVLEIADREEERPEMLYEQLESMQELERLIVQLPTHYRVVLTCYYFEHLAYQEIAELLDQPLGTVKSTISRGVKMLRRLMPTDTSERSGDGIWGQMKHKKRRA